MNRAIVILSALLVLQGAVLLVRDVVDWPKSAVDRAAEPGPLLSIAADQVSKLQLWERGTHIHRHRDPLVSISTLLCLGHSSCLSWHRL